MITLIVIVMYCYVLYTIIYKIINSVSLPRHNNRGSKCCCRVISDSDTNTSDYIIVSMIGLFNIRIEIFSIFELQDHCIY